MQLAQYTEYDRITDILMYLSSSFTLNFNVILSKKDKSGSRSFFQYETEYGSKFIGTDKGRSIKRIMQFFFTIDNKKDFTNSFMMRLQDVYLITTIIEKRLFPLIFGERRVYKIIEKQLVIVDKVDPILYAQSEYKFLLFEPIVYQYENKTYKEGVRISVNSKFDTIDMDIDKFLGFYYLLKTTDMYTAAATLINFVKLPPHGINVYSQIGLGGGAPLPDWSQTNDISETKEPVKNNFLDNTRRKGD